MAEGVLWRPCPLGYVPADQCPDCTPPQEERCLEGRFAVRGLPGNNANVEIVTYPCRVLGEHTRHNDGMGTTWTIEKEGERIFPPGESS